MATDDGVSDLVGLSSSTAGIPTPTEEGGSSASLRGFDVGVQTACGVGMAVFILQAALVAFVGSKLYPLWWYYLVGPALLIISLFTAATCLRGISRERWRVAAVLVCAVGCVFTAIATTETVTSALTACTPLATAYLCLLGLLDRPVVALPAGGVLVFSQVISSGFTRPFEMVGLGVLALVQSVLLIAVTVAGRLVRSAAYDRQDSHRRLAEALAADRAAVESYSDRREQERELHDTVLNTLTALARASLDDSERLRDRCARDARYLRSLHSAAVHEQAAPAESPSDLAPSHDGERLRLEDGLRSLARRAAESGFEVVLEVEDAIPSLPSAVERALLRAAREGIANAAEHAGTGSVRVQVSADGDGVRVELVDRGVGASGTAGIDRLGIRRSIIERMSDVGGRATLGKPRGGGTQVVLIWPA